MVEFTDEGRTRLSWLGGLPEASARSVLLTVLGELVLPTRQPVWTASLLYVLEGMGVDEPAARRSIARAAEAGWIRAEKHGRQVRWSLAEPLIEAIGDVTRRVKSLTTPERGWDGRCLMLQIMVPGEAKAARRPLNRQLGWIGFGNPMPGLWISPHVDRLTEVQRLIRDLDLRDTTVAFIGTIEDVGLTDAEIVGRAWDLEEVTARYTRLLNTFTRLKPEPGDEILFSLLALVHEWRELPYMDPQLPNDLLPDWIGRQAVDTLAGLHRLWADAAHERWREISESRLGRKRPAVPTRSRRAAGRCARRSS
jgi:phenylacetic acid degradation operon negative regulatory protein